jgi:hypothetical protein
MGDQRLAVSTNTWHNKTVQRSPRGSWMTDRDVCAVNPWCRAQEGSFFNVPQRAVVPRRVDA